MTYRQELAAAHARIAQLEADAVGHVRGETEPTAKKASVAPNAARGWWWPWPFFVFSAVVLTYAFRFGMTLPAALSVGELVPLERGNLLCAIVASMFMVIKKLGVSNARGTTA